MVAVGFSGTESNSSWIVYLALSICINIFIMSAIKMDAGADIVPELASIKISLKAQPSPKTVTQSQPEPAVAEPPQAVVKQAKAMKSPPANAASTPLLKDIVSEETAQQVIPLQQPKKTVSSEVTPTTVMEATETKVEKAESVAESIASEAPIPVPVLSVPATETAQATAGEASKLPPSTQEQAATIIHEAKYRKQTVPVYPSRALELGQQGTVTLHAEVMTSGAAGELKVVKSSGYRLLDKAALAAVKQWEFEPTVVNGNTIVSWVRVPVNFVIQ